MNARLVTHVNIFVWTNESATSAPANPDINWLVTSEIVLTSTNVERHSFVARNAQTSMKLYYILPLYNVTYITYICFSMGSYKCYCVDGYMLESDGHSCVHADDFSPFTLVSVHHQILRYSIKGRPLGRIFTNLSNAVAVDYDWLEQRLYWSDVTPTSSHIGRGFINGTGWEVRVSRISELE